jgi:phosphoglycerate kinase
MQDLENMLKTIEQLDLKGKRVLMRVDFNVPIGSPDGNGSIEDDSRIRAALPTIRYVLDNGASQLVLMTHIDPWDEISPTTKNKKLRTNNVADRLGKLLKQEVTKLDDCVDVVFPYVSVVVLENLRFYKEEKKNDTIFAEKLAKNCDVYVNDAFGTCHRAHASVDAVVAAFKKAGKQYGAGLLVQKEVEALAPLLRNPPKPFYVILGGSKVESKIGVIDSLGKKADKIFVGGKMALAFANVGYIEEAEREKARELIARYQHKLVLPVDYRTEDGKVVPAGNIPAGKNVYDIGPSTITEWRKQMGSAKAIFSNIIVGYFEKPPFDEGTNSLIRKMAELTKKGVVAVIGGGDSVAAVQKLGLYEQMTHVSTGGGASLEFLEGKELPGLKALGFYS